MNMRASNHRLHLPVWWAAALLAAGVAVSAHADKAVETTGMLTPQASPSSAGMAFRGGVVAGANPYGAEAGAKILEQGGNAIGAAVAVTYAPYVGEAPSAGGGGRGFLVDLPGWTPGNVFNRNAGKG